MTAECSSDSLRKSHDLCCAPQVRGVTVVRDPRIPAASSDSKDGTREAESKDGDTPAVGSVAPTPTASVDDELPSPALGDAAGFLGFRSRNFRLTSLLPAQTASSTARPPSNKNQSRKRTSSQSSFEYLDMNNLIEFYKYWEDNNDFVYS